jgi:Na+/melibiose symporter-like transporter
MQHSTEKLMTQKNNPHRNGFLYGVLGFPLALLGIPLYLYLPNYYHQNLELSLTLIGSALLAARLVDVITDPVIGWYSDVFKTDSNGRIKRQWQISIGAVLLLFGSFQLFFPAADTGWSYLFIWSFITYLGWTLVQVPHQAMNAEISVKRTDKTQFAIYREAFAIFGVIGILTLPAAFNLEQNSSAFYQLTFGLLAIMTTIGVVSLFFIKQDQQTQQFAQDAYRMKKNLLDTLALLWRHNRSVFAIMPSYLINNLANAIPATLFMIFVSDYLQLQEYTALFLLTYFAAGILALPIWFELSKHFAKKTVWQASMLLAGFSFAGVFTLQAGDVFGFLLICILTGVSLGVDIAMPSSIQADLTQSASENHVHSAGLLFGIWSMLTKLSLALAIGISFPLLDWAQSNDAFPQLFLVLMYAAVPIVLKIFAWWLLIRFDSHYNDETTRDGENHA